VVRLPLLALLLLPVAADAAPKQRLKPADLPRARKVDPFPPFSPFSTLTIELDAQGPVALGSALRSSPALPSPEKEG
jgi:hypothetical protein